MFNPAVEKLSAAWRDAARRGVPPGKDQIAADLQTIGQGHWRIDKAALQVQRTSAVPLSLNAIAKGVILDKVASRMLDSSSKIAGVMVNIGGDIRVAGALSVDVEIANPLTDAIGSVGIGSLRVTEGAVATSGNSERAFNVAGQSYSHIIDPRTGIPVTQTTSATVLADVASTADVVATICNVLSVSDSIRLVNSLPGVECLLVSLQRVRIGHRTLASQQRQTLPRLKMHRLYLKC
ncbi:MAG: FAD:protein FMN transferase [Rubripirellula sp.]|nr:FAD:protein FMN transferase [Rubripirellula sp.]